MNTDSVDCVRLPYPFPPTKDRALRPGEFCWQPEKVEAHDGSGVIRYLYICMPGDNTTTALRCWQGPDRGIEREWGWDGNEDKPTLTPSLLNPGQWHGYLTAGRLVSC